MWRFRSTAFQLMRVYIQVRLGDGEVGALDLPFVGLAGAVGGDHAEPSGALQDFAGDGPEIFGSVEGFQSVSAGLVDAGNHDGLDHVPGIAHLDHAPVFARAFLDPKRGGIAPHAIDAFAAHELPFAVIAAHEDAHDVGSGRAAQVHPQFASGQRSVMRTVTSFQPSGVFAFTCTQPPHAEPPCHGPLLSPGDTFTWIAA